MAAASRKSSGATKKSTRSRPAATANRGAAGKSPGRPRKGPLDPPSDLDRLSKELWKRTIEQLREQGTWADSDLPLLERYIRSVEVGRRSRAQIAAREKRTPGAGYTTLGSQGQLVQHPDLRTAREAERDANDYAQDLLLTSRARRQHDIRPKSGQSRLGSILAGSPDTGAAGGSGQRGLRAV